ncbi:hypothetical protein [Streptomyces sp. TRM68367]|uniref:hypothetical protein n=1 Tax=Streptomyces sp. TRM68367 TaxID=2758415 RepID=UPI0021D232AA|nr:hypothetical protein [Streptomyces sp. TRM68367]
MGERFLRLIDGGLTSPVDGGGEVPDVWVFQAECMSAFASTWVVRGFSATTIGCYASLLERVPGCFDRPVWQLEAPDVDVMLQALVLAGRAPGTRITRCCARCTTQRYA